MNYNTASLNKVHLYIQSTVLCTNMYINYNTASLNKVHLCKQSTVLYECTVNESTINLSQSVHYIKRFHCIYVIQ